jgi:hypothetical protein
MVPFSPRVMMSFAAAALESPTDDLLGSRFVGHAREMAADLLPIQVRSFLLDPGLMRVDTRRLDNGWPVWFPSEMETVPPS